MAVIVEVRIDVAEKKMEGVEMLFTKMSMFAFCNRFSFGYIGTYLVSTQSLIR